LDFPGSGLWPAFFCVIGDRVGLVDDAGKKKAVLIDLAEWGEVWEDIYDVLVARSREDDPTVDWEVLKAEMTAEENKTG
jgi:hypothetical protein